MILFYVAGPHRAGTAGAFQCLQQAEVGAPETQLGKGKERRGLPSGPSFSLRAGLTPFVNRFVF